MITEIKRGDSVRLKGGGDVQTPAVVIAIKDGFALVLTGTGRGYGEAPLEILELV